MTTAEKKGQELAESMSNFVNAHDMSPNAFIETVLRDHALLQARTIRLMLKTIFAMADNPRDSMQNADTIKGCKQIKDMFEGYIPNI